MPVGDYFKAEEFLCTCDRGAKCDAPKQIDMALLLKLNGIRRELGEPMHVNSGCRCPYWNGKVGGEPGSYHLEGKAADIACPNGDYMRRLIILALKHGITGIGIKKRMIHLDVRPTAPVVFGY